MNIGIRPSYVINIARALIIRMMIYGLILLLRKAFHEVRATTVTAFVKKADFFIALRARFVVNNVNGLTTEFFADEALLLLRTTN